MYVKAVTVNNFNLLDLRRILNNNNLPINDIMINAPDRKQKALDLFNEGYNCAQAILAVYGEEFGLNREYALKIGAPFGGGIANTGDVCGAVTGALMVIGLRYADIKPEHWFKRARLYRTSRKFMENFAKAGKSVKCADIKKCIAEKHGGIERDERCTSVVEHASLILEDLL
jgi:C_GCAxxG_C_C family probable redox protein